MKTKPMLTAVVVTYNSRKVVGSALAALRTMYESGLLLCVVVDNASKDGTAGFVSETFPWTILIRSERNLGFARGCNLGFERVETPYVLIQNPDAVMGSLAVHRLLGFLENHDSAGIAAPAIVEGDGTLQCAGLMTTPMTLLRAAVGLTPAMKTQKRIDPASAPFQTSWVCGAAMMIRSELFWQLRGFDPRFFLYFEETDLCRRTTRAGFEIWAVGEAQAEHTGGASASVTENSRSSPYISAHFYRSRVYYLVKHFGWTLAVTSEVVLRLSDILRAWSWKLRGRESRSTELRARPFLRLPYFPDEMP